MMRIVSVLGRGPRWLWQRLFEDRAPGMPLECLHWLEGARDALHAVERLAVAGSAPCVRELLEPAVVARSIVDALYERYDSLSMRRLVNAVHALEDRARDSRAEPAMANLLKQVTVARSLTDSLCMRLTGERRLDSPAIWYSAEHGVTVDDRDAASGSIHGPPPTTGDMSPDQADRLLQSDRICSASTLSRQPDELRELRRPLIYTDPDEAAAGARYWTGQYGEPMSIEEVGPGRWKIVYVTKRPREPCPGCGSDPCTCLFR